MPSSLLFLRGTALVAQPFNVSTLALEGEASLIAPDVAPGLLRGIGMFSAANNGVLAFVKTRGSSAGQLTWFNRAGQAMRSIPQPPGAEYLNPAISPSGEEAAVNFMDPQTGNWDVWVVDLIRGIPTRITFDPAGMPIPSGRRTAKRSRSPRIVAAYSGCTGRRSAARRLKH